MIYRCTERFAKSFRLLPKNIQEKARKAFSLFKENPWHPSLRIKKIQGASDIWEGRIDEFHRFTFEYQTDPESGQEICVFRNIGPHGILDSSP